MRLSHLVLMLGGLCPLWCQIPQSHPEYCGQAAPTAPLPDVSATVDRPNGRAVLHLRRGGSTADVALEDSFIEEISQVCPLSDGRLVVFGDVGGAMAVYIVGKAPARAQDRFLAYTPAISPDERWIAFVKFFPLHGVDGSAQYMLYDLSKSAAQNRPGQPSELGDVGAVIYPQGQENFPGSNIDVPPSEQHFFPVRLYWAPDSRANAFLDLAGPQRDQGIVLTTLHGDGSTAAFRRNLTLAEICGNESGLMGNPFNWRIEGLTIGMDAAGGRSISLNLIPAFGSGCAEHTLQLTEADFQPAKTELRSKPVYTRGIVVDGVQVVPPKKKQ